MIRVQDGKVVADCTICHETFGQPDMIKSMQYCKKCWSAYMRQRRYGITPDEWEVLMEKQEGKCAICGGDNRLERKNSNLRNLAVDHDKKSGKVRGLLCGPCNRGIGLLRHDPQLIQRAARYLVGFST